MFGEKYIFDVAVYSGSNELFLAQREKKLQSHFDWLNKMSLPDMANWSPASNDEFSREARGSFIQKYGGWQFTQIVGWVRLFPLKWQMRGEYWFVNSKRINVHMNNKKFEYYGKAFELSYFSGKETSADIFREILKEFDKLKNESPFRGRYIDLEPLQNIGLFVNWRDLIGLGS